MKFDENPNIIFWGSVITENVKNDRDTCFKISQKQIKIKLYRDVLKIFFVKFLEKFYRVLRIELSQNFSDLETHRITEKKVWRKVGWKKLFFGMSDPIEVQFQSKPVVENFYYPSIFLYR